ncbi:MAG: L-glutamate gamma-semialdehyde dehydrogenase [Planctomycetota bacterium]|nr:L-glutamate gamma-semialdehyde dehydrogenase [Planctomycetota bacterium]
MSLGHFRVPTPINEPVKAYAPGSAEKASLKKALTAMSAREIEIPLVVGGKRIKTGNVEKSVMPHDHARSLATYHQAGTSDVEAAIQAAEAARPAWSAMPFEARAAIFLRAAEMLATTHRDRVNAATMLGQSKTVHQAEIDSACELIDFWRWNPHFAERLYQEQPVSSPGVWNRMEHRPLDGFVFAITPFNFTSIAGNLPTAPALMGNTVLWKPASTSVYSNWFLMELLEEAGLPPGVINFLPGSGATVGDPVVASKHLGGVHFTGSTGVFNGIWGSIGKNIARYGQYPRIVGETGGKDFIFAHASCDVQALCVALLRGAFEYQGQKCSAASRAYIPKSLWKKVQASLGEMLAGVKVGDVLDFTNFMGAVIDKKSFAKLKGAIEAAQKSKDARVVFGGGADDSRGYFIQPTVIEALDPRYDTMCTELFGPVLTIHVYEDKKFEATLAIAATTSDYALTGAIFADDREAVVTATNALRFAAGNFYVNDKPTGAIVGQQPFGGSRASGTNDKAGSILNLMRWVSPRSIKETLVPPRDWRYSFLSES